MVASISSGVVLARNSKPTPAVLCDSVAPALPAFASAILDDAAQPAIALAADPQVSPALAAFVLAILAEVGHACSMSWAPACPGTHSPPLSSWHSCEPASCGSTVAAPLRRNPGLARGRLDSFCLKRYGLCPLGRPPLCPNPARRARCAPANPGACPCASTASRSPSPSPTPALPCSLARSAASRSSAPAGPTCPCSCATPCSSRPPPTCWVASTRTRASSASTTVRAASSRAACPDHRRNPERAFVETIYILNSSRRLRQNGRRLPAGAPQHPVRQAGTARLVQGCGPTSQPISAGKAEELDMVLHFGLQLLEHAGCRGLEALPSVLPRLRVA